MKATIRQITAILVVFHIALVGCQPAHEQSVRPEVNKEYKGEINVQTWVERFEGESREIFAHREQIVDLVNPRPGMVVADVGAGTGLFTRLFAEKVRALPGGCALGSGRVFAIDIVPEFLRHIESAAKTSKLKNITTVLCKEDSVELPPNSIDLAFICDTYHHFEYPRSTMQSIHRALREDGVVIVIDFERIEGQSRQWILDHVRAGKDVVRKEITSYGFYEIATQETPFLKENYVLRFRKQ